jgi:hypothetical protein
MFMDLRHRDPCILITLFSFCLLNHADQECRLAKHDSFYKGDDQILENFCTSTSLLKVFNNVSLLGRSVLNHNLFWADDLGFFVRYQAGLLKYLNILERFCELGTWKLRKLSLSAFVDNFPFLFKWNNAPVEHAILHSVHVPWSSHYEKWPYQFGLRKKPWNLYISPYIPYYLFLSLIKPILLYTSIPYPAI